MADGNVVNTVARVGWFGAKVYIGTPAFEGTEGFVRLPIGGARPKYVVAKQAAKYTAGVPTEPVHCVVVPTANIGTSDNPNFVAKLYLFDKAGAAITSADASIQYEIILME